MARGSLERRHPVHVTLKLNAGLPSLKKKEIFRVLREAVRKARQRGFLVNHFAILSNHIHLIMEPREASLAGPVRSFSVSFSKRLNALLGRRGSVFFDRYHVVVLRTPLQVRHALAYVLTNEARHRLRAAGIPASRGALQVRIDPYSSAWAFRDWKGLFTEWGKRAGRVSFSFSNYSEDFLDAWLREWVIPPRTWLLSQGWRRGPV